MTDLTQKVKYEVVVDLGQLNTLKTALDAAEKAAKDLGTALDKLAGSNVKGLRQLGGTVQALGTRLEKFATTTDPASAAITRLKAALDAVPPAAAKVATAVKKTGDEVEEVGNKTAVASRKTDDWRLSLLKYYGTFQVFSNAARQVWQGIQEGAQQVDLDNTLTKQFANFREEIERAQTATSGTVGRGQLTRSFALMSSFGIPMDQFAENMELVQKMAIRTGQSADFLSDSFARGISRLSPLILDNLGIQVSLGEANEEYAASTGIAVSQMTKQERIGALLNHVLEKLKENTQGISLASDSASAAVNRANAAWDNFWLGVKEAGGTAIMELDRSFAGAAADAMHLATTLDGAVGGAFDGFNKDIRLGSDSLAEYSRHVAGLGEDYADLLERWDELGGRAWGTTLAGMATGGAWTGKGIFAGVENVGELADDIIEVQRLWDAAQLSSTAGADSIVAAYNSLVDLNDAQLQAAVPAIAWTDMLSRSDDLAQKYIASSKEALSTNEQDLIRQKVRDVLQTQFNEKLREAFRIQKATGDDLGDILVNTFRQGDAQGDVNAALERALGLRRDSIRLNEQEAMFYEGVLNAQRERAAHEEKMFKLRAGSTLTQLNLAAAESDRSRVLSEIAKIEEKINEGMTEQLQDARDIKYEELARIDSVRSAAQAAQIAEERWLISFKDKSKEVVKTEITRLRTLAEQLEVMEKQDKLKGGFFSKVTEGLGEHYKAQADKLEKQLGAGGGSSVSEKAKEYLAKELSLIGEAAMQALVAEGKVLEAMTKDAERLRETRRALTVALLEDPSGKKAADVYAELMKQLAEMEDLYGKAETRSFIKAFLGQNFVHEVDIARAKLDELSDAFNNLVDSAQGLLKFSTALDQFRLGMSSIHGDLFGGEFISMIDDTSAALENMAEIQQKNADATIKSHNAYNNVLGGMGIMRAFTQNLIKDRKDQAKVEMLMQAAAAWAAWAIPDPVKAMGHTMAATMYAAVGFGAVKLPSGKAKSTTPRESRNGGGGEAKRPDIHIHISGSVVQTEAERGVMAANAIAEARRRGMA